MKIFLLIVLQLSIFSFISASDDVAVLTNSSPIEKTEFDEAEEPITGLDRENKLNGLLLEKLVKEDSNFLKLALLFNEDEDDSKLTFFKTIQKDENSIVIDIYDTQLANNIVKSLHNSSLIDSKVIKFNVDLNERVPGMKPDIRKVVRLTLTSKHKLNSKFYKESQGSINLNLSWKEKKKVQWTDFMPFF